MQSIGLLLVRVKAGEKITLMVIKQSLRYVYGQATKTSPAWNLLKGHTTFCTGTKHHNRM